MEIAGGILAVWCYASLAAIPVLMTIQFLDSRRVTGVEPQGETDEDTQ